MSLKESFKWLPPLEIYREEADGARLYKVRAITATITGNRRKYGVAELKAAARSLGRRLLNLNHDHAKRLDPKGNETIDFDFEDNGVEGVIKVSDPYVNKLYDEGHIKHVSVEAQARANPAKGDITEPQGILFTELALVTDEETPGDPESSIELLETRKEFLLSEIFEGIPIGEPFAGYKDFDACVLANKDKDDPESYCAVVMRKVESHSPTGGDTTTEKGGETHMTEEDNLEVEILETLDTIPEDFDFKTATLEEVKKWIPKDLVKGGLHRMLGVPMDKPIPMGMLQKAAKAVSKLGQRARFALNARSFKHTMPKETLTPEKILELALAAAPDPPEEKPTVEEQAAAAGVTITPTTTINAAGIPTAGKPAKPPTAEELIAQVKVGSIRNDDRIREDVNKRHEGILRLITKLEDANGQLREKFTKLEAAALSKADLEASKTKIDVQFSGKLAESAQSLVALNNTLEANVTSHFDKFEKRLDGLLAENTQLKETVEQHKANITALTETVQKTVKGADEFLGKLNEMDKGYTKLAEALVDRHVLSEVPFKGTAPDLTETTSKPEGVPEWQMRQFEKSIRKRK